MSKGLRLSEKWFNRGLWLIAIIFASFLIGLGDSAIRDLPQVEHHYTLDDFLDRPAADKLRTELGQIQQQHLNIQEQMSQAQLKRSIAATDYRTAHETFNNWLATRHATAQPGQDEELMRRTQALDDLQKSQREAIADVETLEQQALQAEQLQRKTQQTLNEMENAARKELTAKQRSQEIKVFVYRLALTLPLLAIAAWLFTKKRKTAYWPFVWGFIYFALFAFFVELVPYLPSYGGYVRSIVGIVLTVIIGRQAIISLNRYLEKQRQAEQQPEIKRREELGYDIALARLAKSVCPGCERHVDLKDASNDFCPHCGIGLHDYCGKCESRKSAFARFCHRCGTTAAANAAT